MIVTRFIIAAVCIASIISCKEQVKETPPEVVHKDSLSPDQAFLKEALTFYTSFDSGTDAVVAGGDKRMYSVPNRKQRDSARLGLHKPGVAIACLLYTSPSPRDRQKSRMPSSA